MLSREDIRHLSSGTGGTYIFDLSKIRHTSFEPLLKAVEKYGVNSIQNLVFNTDLKDQFPDAAELKPMIDYSVISVVPHFFNRLIVLIKRLTATSKVLKEIHINSMKIPRGSIQALSEILKKPSSLKLIEFKDIHIYDKDIGGLFDQFDTEKIPSIIFNNCGLTDDSIEPIIKYLNRYSMAHPKRRIPKIELPGNHISDYGLKQVQRVTTNSVISDDSDSSIGIIKIEDADPIQSDVNKGNQNACDNVISQVELDSAFKNLFGPIKLHNYGDLPDQRLMAENEKLKIQIQRLKLIIDDVNNNDAIYILGDNVSTTVEYMKNIEQRLNNLNV